MKIVNKKKFARFICILILFIMGITQIVHTKQNDWLKDYNTTDIYVGSGETLWTIAEEYVTDDIDIRDYIYEVQKLNNMKSSNVYEGDIITIYAKGRN